MPPPHNEITGDALRRFTLLTPHLRRQEATVVKSANPLDEFINEQRNLPHDELSQVRQVADIFEAKMSKKERWDGWRWTPPVHKEFGFIGDGKGKAKDFTDSDSNDDEK